MGKGYRSWLCLVVVCAAVVLPSVLLADVTGSILGTVTDTSSAIIQGVRVTATNLDLNLVKEASTNESGQYRFMALPVGRYKLEASFAGFRNFVQTGIVLSVNDQRRVDVVLQVGEALQEVNVSAEALQVESTNTQLGEVIEQKKILELPLNGRGYVELLGLQPGVAPGGRDEGAGTVSVNGQRENSNGFLVNGGDVSGVVIFDAQISPNLDAVQEFRLITNSFDAEYGRFSGGLMNTVTKSGTNSIHGTVFEFLRNDHLDARGFFDGPEKGRLAKNQFGYAVGGAAIKDKLFWFTDYQGTRRVDGGQAREVQVLSQAERQGNVGVANLTGAVNGPYWANVLWQRLGRPVHDGQPYAEVFPDGIIPQSAFSSAAVGTLQFIPNPNRGENIYASAAESVIDRDDMAGNRVDFLNKKTGDWSVYYYFDGSNVLDPKAGGTFPGFAGTTKGTRQQATVSNTRIFGPTAVNEFRMNYTRIPINVVPESTAPSLESMGFITGNDTLGINNSGPAGYTGVPYIGLNNFSFGSVSPDIQVQNTYQIGDNFSKIMGRHTLKFGAGLRYYQLNLRGTGAPFGAFRFDGSETGYDVADYLLGAPLDFTQASTQLLDSRSKYGSAYAQDSIQVRSNLTLNVGLRWEFSQPWYDTQDKIQTMIPGQQSTQYPTAPRGLLYPGDAGIARTLAPTRYNNFASRLGIAWSPKSSEGILGKLFGGPGKTSVRIGSGMFYTAIQDETLYWILATPPFGAYWLSPSSTLFEEPYRTRSSGASQGQKFPFVIPTPGSPEAKNFDFSRYLPMSNTVGYWKDNALPYGIHYNLTIQRQLTSSMVLSLGYVGTLGRKLIAIVENNPGDPKLCLSLRGAGVMPGTDECGQNGEDSIYTRPDGTLIYGTRTRFPGGALATGYDEGLWANSSYNSLQASLEKRSGNLSFLLGYTLSKSMDNASYFANRMNYENFAVSKSLSSFDNTHNFVASYTYTVPFDRTFPSAPKPLVAGWAIAGITRFATGAPVRIFSGGDRSLRGTSGLERPDFVGPLTISDNLRSDDHRWFNNDAFTVSSPEGLFGNANQRFFHGPGINNWDMGIHKDTKIRENLRFQFRAELFNAFNHAQFYAPNGLYNPNPGSTFGRVSSARAPRIVQFGVKIIF
ncbi:MAG TPA: carboxypeptidase-like regulatory domain-containing protein [Terriglobia bacterium]|nr:carboxypeptidase-like regulatory domain-containing protein [Terriglobia bacterium]